MNQHNTTGAWRQYEAGREYKRRIGLYQTVRRNERFYRGDQWQGGPEGLPRPVFNLVKRIADYLICTVAAEKYVITYTDENLPFNTRASGSRAVKRALSLLTDNARYRWEKCQMDNLIYRLLLDAAISGDGALMCYWDTRRPGDGLFRGDIGVQAIDSVDIYPADVNKADIQSQDYIIVAGRASVASLRREAAEAGLGVAEQARILPDRDVTSRGGDMAENELDDGGEGKATYLIKFYREDGRVVFEKSVKELVIRRVVTDMHRYPLAYFSWIPTKNSFHGTAPISALVPNQQYINRAYAMAMKHMTDTAFSKVVYDKSRIPEWSNEVGEAIAVVGAANVSDAVSVVDGGRMQADYLTLIDMAASATKELSGATETALGNTAPTNTSAILALKETSRVTLKQVIMSLATCVEDLALIWADMMCAYYPEERLIPYLDREGRVTTRAGLGAARDCLLAAKVEVSAATGYGETATLAVLDKLLDGGYITPRQYVAHLPEGLMVGGESLWEKDDAEEGGEPNGEL